MLFQHLSKTTMLRIALRGSRLHQPSPKGHLLAPKHSSSNHHVKSKLFHTFAAIRRIPTEKWINEKITNYEDIYEGIYGPEEAVDLAEDILGEADVAGVRMIEMDKQIVRELLWHIHEGTGMDVGSLKSYLAKKKRQAEEAAEAVS